MSKDVNPKAKAPDTNEAEPNCTISIEIYDDGSSIITMPNSYSIEDLLTARKTFNELIEEEISEEVSSFASTSIDKAKVTVKKGISSFLSSVANFASKLSSDISSDDNEECDENDSEISDSAPAFDAFDDFDYFDDATLDDILAEFISKASESKKNLSSSIATAFRKAADKIEANNSSESDNNSDSE